MGTIEPGFIGFIAGFGTTFAALPDLITMLRRRSVDGMKPRMAAITAAFQIVWIYYGLLIDSTTVVLWNVIAVASNSLTVAAYFYFLRRALPAAPSGDPLIEPESIH
jgi:MtN3 and saliva related transmembrane protein